MFDSWTETRGIPRQVSGLSAIEGQERTASFCRRFVIADSNGKFLTAREAPTLVLVEPVLENDVLTLVAPGRQPVKADLNKAVANGKVSRVT